MSEPRPPYRAKGDGEAATRAFPRLRLVEGRGFDHEIIDDDEASRKPMATVFASAQASGEDPGLRLARLFTAAPRLYEACQAAEFCLSLIAKESDLTADGHALKLIHAAMAQAEGRPSMS